MGVEGGSVHLVTARGAITKRTLARDMEALVDGLAGRRTRRDGMEGDRSSSSAGVHGVSRYRRLLPAFSQVAKNCELLVFQTIAAAPVKYVIELSIR